MRRGAGLIAASALVLAASACGGGGGDTLPALAATTTTVAASTSTLATTTTTTSTLAPSTTPPPPPTTPPPPSLAPIAPPPEDGSDEPRVQVGTIEIPKIGLAAAMWEGIKLSTLDRGPGHWPGTAMPGEVGNVVVAGHRVSHNHEFRYVDRLAPGDDVVMTTAAGRFTYVVTSTEVVAPDALWIVDQTAEPTATLFACHPPGSVRQRIVVHLRLAS
jgi:sortase A